MNMSLSKSVLAAATALLFLAPDFAPAQSSPKRGEIQFIAPELQYATLGERADLELVFGMRTGEYLTDVHVKLTDALGTPLLDTVTDKPFLNLAMPRGRYQVHATFGGRTLSRTVDIDGSRPVTEEFRWGLYIEDVGATGGSRRS